MVANPQLCNGWFTRLWALQPGGCEPMRLPLACVVTVSIPHDETAMTIPCGLDE
jgi:hypothetical protein